MRRTITRRLVFIGSVLTIVALTTLGCERKASDQMTTNSQAVASKSESDTIKDAMKSPWNFFEPPKADTATQNDNSQPAVCISDLHNTSHNGWMIRKECVWSAEGSAPIS